MPLRRIAMSAAFAAGLVIAPLTSADAQYYPPPCSPFPLFWPFCIAGAAVVGAVGIATLPVRALTPPPYPYYGRPYPPPPPPYYRPGYYPPPPPYYGPPPR
jgi:hypothetical protein